jgi:ABC-2 type transport system ATP-binding protein
MLAGISRPTSGTATVLGEEISPDLPKSKFKIGYMPELPGFYAGMRAMEHLMFWADLYHVPKVEAMRRAKDLLGEVGLGEAGRRKAKEFSHGMKKRLALAGALIADPEVLILDEPSGGLDPEGTIFFRSLMERLKREGKTIFLSSHLLPEVQMICTRVGIINRGQMIALDSVEELTRKVISKAPARVQVECPPLTAEQIAAIGTIPGILGWMPAPGGIFVTAAPGVPLGFELNRALLAAGVRVEAFWRIIPSLEEVFLQLVQEAQAGGPAK